MEYILKHEDGIISVLAELTPLGMTGGKFERELLGKTVYTSAGKYELMVYTEARTPTIQLVRCFRSDSLRDLVDYFINATFGLTEGTRHNEVRKFRVVEFSADPGKYFVQVGNRNISGLGCLVKGDKGWTTVLHTAVLTGRHPISTIDVSNWDREKEPHVIWREDPPYEEAKPEVKVATKAELNPYVAARKVESIAARQLRFLERLLERTETQQESIRVAWKLVQLGQYEATVGGLMLRLSKSVGYPTPDLVLDVYSPSRPTFTQAQIRTYSDSKTVSQEFALLTKLYVAVERRDNLFDSLIGALS